MKCNGEPTSSGKFRGRRAGETVCVVGSKKFDRPRGKLRGVGPRMPAATIPRRPRPSSGLAEDFIYLCGFRVLGRGIRDGEIKVGRWESRSSKL